MDATHLGAGAVSEVITGTLAAPGVECPQFQLQDGELVSLTGKPPQDPGSYQLTGRWARFSYCMQGRSFDVLTHQPMPSDDPNQTIDKKGN